MKLLLDRIVATNGNQTQNPPLNIGIIGSCFYPYPLLVKYRLPLSIAKTSFFAKARRVQKPPAYF